MKIETNIFGELARAIGLSIPSEDMSSMEVPNAMLKVSDFPQPLENAQIAFSSEIQRSSFTVRDFRATVAGGPDVSQVYATLGRGVWRMVAQGQVLSAVDTVQSAVFDLELQLLIGGASTTPLIIGGTMADAAAITTFNSDIVITLPNDLAILQGVFQGLAAAYNAGIYVYCAKLL